MFHEVAPKVTHIYVPRSQMVLLWLLKIPVLLIILMLLALLMLMLKIMKLRFGQDPDDNAKKPNTWFRYTDNVMHYHDRGSFFYKMKSRSLQKRRQ